MMTAATVYRGVLHGYIGREALAAAVKAYRSVTEKIDGIVALIMGLDRAVRHEQVGSVYDRDDYELQVF